MTLGGTLRDECSLLAFRELMEQNYFATERGKVLFFLVRAYPAGLTGYELQEAYAACHGRDIRDDEVRARVSELKSAGFVQSAGKTRCPGTNRVVNVWRWTERSKPLPPPFLQACRLCRCSSAQFESVEGRIRVFCSACRGLEWTIAGPWSETMEGAVKAWNTKKG